MQLLHPENFTDYELIDCGNLSKLERFGEYVTIRPEPQAVWDPIYSFEKWKKLAHIEFAPQTSTSGKWVNIKPMPDQWKMKLPFVWG